MPDQDSRGKPPAAPSGTGTHTGTGTLEEVMQHTVGTPAGGMIDRIVVLVRFAAV
jgi:hypothetical protein